MTLEQLRIFVAVAECEHLTRAANNLQMTPSAVSAAIHALEERHGVALFDRVARHIELTETGRGFLIEAREVLARAEMARVRLDDLAGRICGPLRIEASLTIASYWLPARLVDFNRLFPDIGVDINIANTATVERSVKDGNVELGFIEGACQEKLLTVKTIARDHLQIIAAMGKFSRQKRLFDTDLLALNWVLRERGSGTRSEFEAELSRRGFDPSRLKVVLTLPSNEAVLAAVAAGGGVTATSASVAASCIANGAIDCLDPDFVERSFQLLRHAERMPSRAALAFISFLSGKTEPEVKEPAFRQTLPLTNSC